ncbi:3'-5' exonuclease, partial [Pseudomonadota bacterium]
GSDIKYILSFEEKYSGSEVISLTKNYRSTKPIVDLVNKSISSMKLPDLEAFNKGEKDIKLVKFANEDSEFEFVVQGILNSDLPRKEIFVLARTNKQLNELSRKLKQREIDHIIRSEEQRRNVIAEEDQITLATVHAIKGMEAEVVFLIGASGVNFPCKGSEHPVIEMVKVDEYDKEEEERRLFYVAMSRAKKSLYISYNGKKPTRFFTSEMNEMISGKKDFDLAASGSLVKRLKDWRNGIAVQLGVPAYMVLHDRSLIDISVRQPLTKAELENIHGLGPSKIMKYGSDILDIVGGMK